MRSSPAAIGRIFLQPTGRGRGKRASIPSIETRTTTIFDEQYGAIEAEVTTHGKAIPLLQLLFLENGTIAFTGGDHALPEGFLQSVQLALGETVLLVQKHKDEKLRHYRVETFEWTEGGYVSKSHATVDRPPTTCIWCEALAPTSEKNAQQNRAPTLYQRLAGQINLRIPQDISVASLLSNARVAVSEFRGRPSPYKVIENPLVHVSMSMDIEDYGRVLAKIGMNLLTHVYGEDYARHHAFKRIKRLILHGGENIPWVSPPTAGDGFNGVPLDKHVAMLFFSKSRAGRYHVALFIRLYGGNTLMVQLSSNATKPPDRDAIMVIHYKEHRIELFTKTYNFVACYPPNRPPGSVSWQQVYGAPLEL